MQSLLLSLDVLMLLTIGYLSREKTNSADDFFPGAAPKSPWVSAFASGTTCLNAVVFLGYAGKLSLQ